MKAGDTRTIILDDPEDVEAALLGVYDALETTIENVSLAGVFPEKIFPAIERAEEGYFASETDASGQPWPKLQPSTVAHKGHDVILVEKGDLRAGLVGQTADSIRDAGDDFGTFGTTDPKAAFHQYGTSKMPARPPVGLSEDLIQTICRIVGDAYIAQIQGF